MVEMWGPPEEKVVIKRGRRKRKTGKGRNFSNVRSESMSHMEKVGMFLLITKEKAEGNRHERGSRDLKRVGNGHSIEGCQQDAEVH